MNCKKCFALAGYVEALTQMIQNNYVNHFNRCDLKIHGLPNFRLIN